ncbi:flagellar filament capping protein FliD [Aquabacterium sp.]|uniref:flagellar filament capping protein FliD n=1 Tax=Aquabacterium sp. TaxID=1872578 RepID=UPI00199B9335|nr:flagellar filament capping protein FliD [Aquabacterium sp.]MBC7699407.1 flagellar filament capping protein FliD [Aquabacterium sp.]
MASSITSLGIGSGLDANTIVTKLVALESQPITNLQTASDKLQTKISAYGQIQSAVSSVRDAARKLTSVDLWGATAAASADATAVNATTSAGAQIGTYSIDVTALAKPQSVVTKTSLASGASTLGSGTLTLDVGTWTGTSFAAKSGATPVTITVAATDTLANIRDKVNSSNSGVKASIVTDSSGSRLVMQSATTGEANGFRVTVADAGDGNDIDNAGLSALAYDPGSTTAGTSLSQGAADAEATINNVPIKSATNTLSEVVSGLSITLSKVTSSPTITTGPITITVSQDTATITKAVADFATAYSSMATLLKANTKYEESSKAAGVLQGDSGALSVQNQFRSILGNSSAASTTFDTLSSVGLEIQTDGTVKVNSTKLTSALGNLAEVKKLFSNSDSVDPTKDGIMTRLRVMSDSLMGTDGILTVRTAGLKQTITDNQSRQESLQNRVDLYEKRLKAQYTALDTIMAGLTSQGNYVTQMINSLNRSN